LLHIRRSSERNLLFEAIRCTYLISLTDTECVDLLSLSYQSYFVYVIKGILKAVVPRGRHPAEGMRIVFQRFRMTSNNHFVFEDPVGDWSKGHLLVRPATHQTEDEFLPELNSPFTLEPGSFNIRGEDIVEVYAYDDGDGKLDFKFFKDKHIG